MVLFKSCRELGGIDISMIYGKDGILVQNCCIVLKSSPLSPFKTGLLSSSTVSHRTKIIIGPISAAEQ